MAKTRGLLVDEGDRTKKHRKTKVNLAPVEKWYETPLIRIGNRTITRRDIIASGCGNMRSINRMVRFMRQHQIKSAADLWAVDPIHCLNRCKSFGVFTVFAGMHFLEILGHPHPQKWGEREARQRRGTK